MNAGVCSLPDIMRSIHIGLSCVQQNVNDRPTMASTVSMLNSSSVTFSIPSQPIFFNSHTHPQMPLLQEYSSSGSQLSINNVSMSEIYPR
ncbi:phosphorylase kinase, gamma catalytic subunit [Artemisia annua]|uniref:Phosphorylase kinase, gamma catalytic subunit n=1 Tax=Artemisia annua TaxID=35608 RepID=A0A2U1PNQ3_ARTAN|nr:phosphorylase kinase, gamma catalytic subunit [Artemisia annua]